MQKKLLPLLLLPVFVLASCGGTSTPTAPGTNVNTDTKTTAPTPGTKNQTLDAGDQTMTAEETQLLKELNAARAVGRTCGSKYMPPAPPVTWNGYLATSARAHANDMANRSYFAHYSPEGKGVQNRAEAAGYTNWTELGENLAGGFTLNTVTQGWIDSPGHCTTLMDGKLKEVGIAFIYRSGTQFGTYGVQNFGTR